MSLNLELIHTDERLWKFYIRGREDYKWIMAMQVEQYCPEQYANDKAAYVRGWRDAGGQTTITSSGAHVPISNSRILTSSFSLSSLVYPPVNLTAPVAESPLPESDKVIESSAFVPPIPLIVAAGHRSAFANVVPLVVYIPASVNQTVSSGGPQPINITGLASSCTKNQG